MRLPRMRWLQLVAGTSLLAGAGATAIIGPNNIKKVPVGSVRLGRAVVTVGSIVIDYKRTIYTDNLDENSTEYALLRSQVHKRSAEKLLDLCCVNGGCFIKVGQHAGALQYLLPSEYVQTLCVLHSDAPASSLDDVKEVIKLELGKEIDELFLEFSPTPVGAASLAQVHSATTLDGRLVAVKVQHKAVLEHVELDLWIMEGLVWVVSRVFPEFKFSWLVEETRRNLPQELDFQQEGRHAEAVATMFSHLPWLKVPTMDWELSSGRVLTMEFCHGGQVNDPNYLRRHNIDPHQVSERLGTLYAEMIFERGYVHSDPHPGNILVDRMADGSPQIVLLDHGLYATVSAATRLSYSQFWRSILAADVAGIQRYGIQLGVGDKAGLLACMVTARSWQSITSGIDNKPIDNAEQEDISRSVAAFLPQITEAMNNMDRQLILLLKTNDLIRGIEYSLGTHRSQRGLLTMSRCCVRSVYKHRLSHCSTFRCRVTCRVKESTELFLIDSFSAYLTWKQKWDVLYNKHLQSNIFVNLTQLPGVRIVGSLLAKSGHFVFNAVQYWLDVAGGIVTVITGRKGDDGACGLVFDKAGLIIEDKR